MLFDLATSAVRAVLRPVASAARELEKQSPIDARLREATGAVHRAADSLERHAVVLEGLAVSLPALSDAIAALSKQLGEVLALSAPLEAAERDVTGIAHLFHRRRRGADAGSGLDPPG